MKLRIGNVFAHATLEPRERHWLAEFLTFDDNSTAWAGGKFKGPRKSSLLTEGDTFPSGLVPLVAKQATHEGMTVELFDAREAPCVFDASANVSWLREHQLKAVHTIAAKTRGVLELPTGAGKTEIAVALTRALPCRWLFLVHRDVLREQTARRFDLRASEHGRAERAVVWSAQTRRPWSGTSFIVASFQGLTSARKNHPTAYNELLSGAQGIIVDEAHVLPSQTFYQTTLDCSAAYYRVALSATAFARGDKRSVLLLSAVGPSVMKVKPQELIDAGLLVQPRVEFWPFIQEAQHRKWSIVEREQIVRCDARNEMIARIVAQCDKPAFVYVKQLEHLTTLRKALEAKGVNALVVSGKESTSQREAALTRLARGDFDAIVCTVVFQEGVDLPALATVVNASGGKSQIAAVQRAGRALRTSKGKTGCTVYDVDDRGVPMLARHTAGRKAAYVKQGYPVTTAPHVTSAATPRGAKR